MNQDALLYELIITDYNKVVDKNNSNIDAIFFYHLSYDLLTSALLEQLNEAGFTVVVEEYSFSDTCNWYKWHRAYKKIGKKIDIVSHFCPLCGGARVPEKHT